MYHINDMKKLMFIVPHLSTGGMPQFVLKQIELLKDEYDIHLIEWDNITGGVYVVQRNLIESLLGLNFFTLQADKKKILDILSDIKPDILHFHEIPETFINGEVLDKIYSSDREYNIVVTTHSSLTDPSSIKYTADRFILVSEWSKDVFESFFKNIECTVWEYPIDKYIYDKDLAKDDLGWDKSYKHVLNVGLFTKGKNQGELFELARTLQNEKIIFHFIGNQAINFKDYWGPLMESLPENCVIHGERNDVDRFYKAADLFYFTSNFELSPLAVKEALSYGLPTFIKKLYTYKNMYDDKVTYITNDNGINTENILKKLYARVDFSNFYWGEKEPHLNFKENILKEILVDNIYESILQVEEGDVVLDIGASIGPFTYSILNKKPKHVYCLEPSIMEFDTLIENTKNGPVTCIKKGLSKYDNFEIDNEYIFGVEDSKMDTININTLFNEFEIDKVDFLKIDCEGGEYDLFIPENMDFIRNKFRKIVGEWHLGTEDLKEKFRQFRDLYLSKLECRVFSTDGFDIKWDLWNDHFINYYSEVIIHIDNTK